MAQWRFVIKYTGTFKFILLLLNRHEHNLNRLKLLKIFGAFYYYFRNTHDGDLYDYDTWSTPPPGNILAIIYIYIYIYIYILLLRLEYIIYIVPLYITTRTTILTGCR